MTAKPELTLLLDYYGAFLTEKQRELLSMSVNEDMSLAEIAEVVGVSRQGVRDVLVKASEKLAGFESRLGLVERDAKLRALIGELEAGARAGDKDAVLAAAGEIRSVLG